MKKNTWLAQLRAWFTDPNYVWTYGPFGVPTRFEKAGARLRALLNPDSDWPLCAVAGCANKSCIRLKSDKCHPHTMQDRLALRVAELEKEADALADALNDTIERSREARAEVERLKISDENLRKTVAHWWPLLGYSKFNEAVYPALGDRRATEAPALLELAKLRALLEKAEGALRFYGEGTHLDVVPMRSESQDALMTHEMIGGRNLLFAESGRLARAVLKEIEAAK